MNLGNFLFEFNHLRKHGGLNYETPFDKLQKVTELVSQYKFKNTKLELIWSGIIEAEHIDVNGIIRREKNDITFVKVDSTNINKIVLKGVEERIDSKRAVLIEKRAVSREFLWDPTVFKYLEKKNPKNNYKN